VRKEIEKTLHQSLYPADSCPALVRRINKALQRADQIDCAQGQNGTYWFGPVMAGAEAGFGRPSIRSRSCANSGIQLDTYA